MITGRALCNLLDGITIQDSSDNTIPVQTNMGNQDALQKFIVSSLHHKQKAFPLIFYVTATVKPNGNFNYVETDLILLVNTHEPMLYKERSDKSYGIILEPIYQEVKKRLTQSQFVDVLQPRHDKLPYTDVPNYGIKAAKPVAKKQEKAAVMNHVDARVIKIKLRVNANCLI